MSDQNQANTEQDANRGAPPPPPPPSAAPTAAATAKKRSKYPVPEGGLAGYPDDFDSSKHLPLQRGDFTDERVYLTRKAEEFEAKAKEFRDEIENVTKFGAGGSKKATKLAAMQNEMELLKKLLEAQGVDVKAELAKLGG